MGFADTEKLAEIFTVVIRVILDRDYDPGQDRIVSLYHLAPLKPIAWSHYIEV